MKNGETIVAKRKPGRPPTERGAYNPLPQRQIGRIADDDWALLKAAAEKSGQTFSGWALAILKRAAHRTLKK